MWSFVQRSGCGPRGNLSSLGVSPVGARPELHRETAFCQLAAWTIARGPPCPKGLLHFGSSSKSQGKEVKKRRRVGLQVAPSMLSPRREPSVCILAAFLGLLCLQWELINAHRSTKGGSLLSEQPNS